MSCAIDGLVRAAQGDRARLLEGDHDVGQRRLLAHEPRDVLVRRPDASVALGAGGADCPGVPLLGVLEVDEVVVDAAERFVDADGAFECLHALTLPVLRGARHARTFVRTILGTVRERCYGSNMCSIEQRFEERR